jgi:hypothetical protein
MTMDAGYAVVRVLSTEFSEEMLGLLPAACKSLQFAASIQVGWASRACCPFQGVDSVYGTIFKID